MENKVHYQVVTCTSIHMIMPVDRPMLMIMGNLKMTVAGWLFPIRN